jgi:predicted enzyme related to lactoylglutathione lyase
MLAERPFSATLPASDLERAKAFYKDKLGLTPIEERMDGVRYETGKGTGFLLYPSAFAGTNQATAAGFQSDDIRGDVKELQDKGVEFLTFEMEGLMWDGVIATMGEAGDGAWFKDSEGNILAIAQM